MDQFQEESYDEFSLNFRVDDTVPVNELELSTFNTYFLGNQSTCQLAMVDGVRVLAYHIPATLPLAQFLKKQLYKGEFLAILSNIMNQLLFFEERNMPIKKVLLNTKYMYIELANLHVQMVYMPIEKDFADCNVCEFIQKFISKIRFADMQCVNCVDQILHYLDSRMMFNLKDFYNFILELQKEEIMKDEDDGFTEGETSVLSSMEYSNITPYLVRLRTNALVPIQKSEFMVGKSSDCDYQVSDNRKISRRHCSFRISNGECYIRDEGSTNHTFVNGKMLQAGFDVMLQNDDYIRMADEEFKYWVR